MKNDYDDWDLDVPDDDSDDWDYTSVSKPEPKQEPVKKKQTIVPKKSTQYVERVEAEIVDVPQPQKRRKGLTCPRCHEDNISIQMVETGSKTKRKGNGLGGNTYNAARGLLAISTLGLSNVVLPKAKGTNKTKTKLQKVAICQNCGHSWNVF